jgi:pimeloyl-ACP methyl ester carboxylesterase
VPGVLSAGTVTHSYGADSRNIFILTLQPEHVEQKKVKLAVVVHGGGFIRGGPEWGKTKIMSDFFLERGYSVGRVSYRVCPDVKWPVPVEDIAEGIQAVFNVLNKGGFAVEDVTYMGHSAGAYAGSLLLYSNNYPSIQGIDRFIGSAGAYNPDSFIISGEWNSPTIKSAWETCGFPPSDFGLFHGNKTSVPALLLEGEKDHLDANPMTEDSHSEYLAGILRENSIYVKTYWAIGEECGHSCPLRLIASGNEEITRIMEEFMRVK